jgi:glyoxylase-like metal-dependent hydrolase (beta-lactamase superfamily II)
MSTPPVSVEEVVPGLWSLPVQIPITGLRHVFAYALEIPDGLVLVDSGWSSSQSLDSLESGLTFLRASLADVRGVLFTHSHGDHYGLAGPVRERSGAWLALHEADAAILRRQQRSTQNERLPAFNEWLIQAGVQPDSYQTDLGADFGWEFPLVLPDRILSDQQHLRIPGWGFSVMHTPGHSPGHVCFIDKEAGLALTGDHVLSRTTPNVSIFPGGPPDPLRQYLRALKRLREAGDLLGLPGHEAKIPSTATRATEILSHHDEQLELTRKSVAEGADTIVAVATQLHWSQPWDELSNVNRILALGEARAHLVTLQRQGDLRLVGERPLRWRVPTDS